METTRIAKADPIGAEIIEPATILIDAKLPEFGKDYQKAPVYFEAEADLLAETLIHKLPGGTFDRLLVKLLQHKASVLYIPVTK